MKRKILIALATTIVLIVLYKLVYKPFIWQSQMKSKEHKLQVGSYIFSTNEIANANTFISETHKRVQIVTEINGDYVRLATIKKVNLPKEILQSYPPNNINYYDNLKNTIATDTITAISMEFRDYHNEDENRYLLRYYPMLMEFPLYYDTGFANKKPSLDARGFTKDEYFDDVYSKKEILKNGSLVSYTLTNQFNGIPVLYDLGEKIELIVNKK